VLSVATHPVSTTTATDEQATAIRSSVGTIPSGGAHAGDRNMSNTFSSLTPTL
jgi:hypothetical protein